MKYRNLSIFNGLFLFGVALLLGVLLPILSIQRSQHSATEAIVENILMEESSLLDGVLKSDFVPYFVAVAKDNELDPLLVLAIMKVESSFKPTARSRAGALGLLQLKPVAAKEVAPELHTQLLNPFVNVKVGARYLSYLKHQVGKDRIRILSAYNLGPTHVKRSKVFSHKYAAKVLKIYTQFLKRYS